jgi:hypothetical protein
MWGEHDSRLLLVKVDHTLAQHVSACIFGLDNVSAFREVICLALKSDVEVNWLALMPISGLLYFAAALGGWRCWLIFIDDRDGLAIGEKIGRLLVVNVHNVTWSAGRAASHDTLEKFYLHGRRAGFTPPHPFH